MFVASKILWFFAAPSNALLMAIVLGVVLTATRFAKLGRRMALLALLIMALAGLSPLPNILLLPLEQRFPVWSEKNGPAACRYDCSWWQC